jgi:ADP-heptose:LPS heptosyltransferase
MENVLERLPSGARVLVIRLRSLGDCVLTTPALALLRQFRPDLRVAVAVEDRFVPVFEGNPDIDRLLPPRVIAVARWRAGLCLNLHGGTRSMALTAASGARFRAGFAHFRASAVFNVRIPTAQEIIGVDRTVHTAEHLASAIFYLGAPVREIPRAKLVAERREPPRPYAVLHPAASAPGKTWPPEHFLAVGRHLESKWGVEPVFIAASGEDLAPFARYRTLAGAPLGEVKNLLSTASLFVGNDSGPAHMAAAFGIPAAVVFGASDPRIWGPWKTPSAALVSPDGIGSIQPGQVIEALEKLRENA